MNPNVAAQRAVMTRLAFLHAPSDPSVVTGCPVFFPPESVAPAAVDSTSAITTLAAYRAPLPAPADDRLAIPCRDGAEIGGRPPHRRRRLVV